MSKGENNYLTFQEINKNIITLFQDRHQRNISSVRNVQRYCTSINPYISADRKFYSMLH